MKIPVIKCDYIKWNKIKPYLIEYGYNIKCVSNNWDIFPYLVLNVDNEIGRCLNTTKPSPYMLDTYNREIVNDMDVFLKTAAALKGKIFNCYFKNNFSKKDLKTGMVVGIKSRDKEDLYLVVGDKLISSFGFLKLKDYDDNLKNIDDSAFDIVNVYNYSDWSDGLQEGMENSHLIWKRKPTKVISKQEVANMLSVNVDDLIITD